MQLAKVVHWIEYVFFFSIYWIRICFVSFIHHFPRLYLFSILSKSFFEYFYWSFTPPLMSIFVLNGLFLAVFVCGDLGPHDGTLRIDYFIWRVVHVFEWETPFFLWNSPFFVGLIHRHTSPGNSSVYDYQVYLDLYKTAFLKKNFFFLKWFHQLTHCFRCAAANSAAKYGKNNHFVERTCFFRRVEIDG